MTFTDQAVFLTLSLLGGLGMVLVGLKYISESFQVLSGRCIHWVINAITKNFFVCLFSGAVISFLVQSGVTTTLMAASSAGSGLLSLSQLCAIMLGSNVGTILTTWLFIADVGLLGTYFMGVGALPMLYSRIERLSYLGKFIFSVGLLLLGYHLIHQGLEEPMLLKNLIDRGLPPGSHPSQIYLTMMGVSVLLSLLVRSSVALMALLMALVSTEVIPGVFAVIAVFGINIGTALPIVFATYRSGTLPRRGAFFHLSSQVLTLTVLSLGFLQFWDVTYFLVSKLLPSMGLNPVYYGDVMMIPMSHFLFNFCLIALSSVLFVPLQWFVRLCVRGSGKKEPQQLQLLGRISQMSPSLALEQALQEVKKLAAMVESIIQLTYNAVTGAEDQEKEGVEKTLKYEAITDNVQNEVMDFLSRVMEVPLSTQQGRMVKSMMRVTDELESVADSCKEIISQYEKLKQQSPSQVQALRDALNEYFAEVHSYYEWIFTDLAGAENDEIESQRDYIQRSEELKQRQSDLLAEYNKKIKDPELTRVITNILVSLNLIRAYTKNIFEAISGARKSRG